MFEQLLKQMAEQVLGRGVTIRIRKYPECNNFEIMLEAGGRSMIGEFRPIAIGPRPAETTSTPSVSNT